MALLAMVLPSGCVSSAWENTESVPGGRLYIPKVYAPLLPGSIYPNKNVPVPTKNRPAMVVACPPKGDCREKEILDQAAQRGIVVLVLTRPPSGPPMDDLLRTRVEASAEHTGWLLVEPTGEFLRRWMNAATSFAAGAVIGPPRPAAHSFPSYPSRNLLFLAIQPAEAFPAPDGAVLKLYAARPSGGLPREAFRDAVEWLAGELGAR